jgi:hypothetical protein
MTKPGFHSVKVGDVVYAACRECTYTGPLTVVETWDHCEDSVGGLVLRVVDEAGRTHVVFGHDVATRDDMTAVQR